ncbi:MAG TPA: cysteine--tRNA ligase, partial [Candidatus Aminicenantes bacterium]|nr:cysteine--tRNA ligase [Candidatus Aminicenantes bacterium]
HRVEEFHEIEPGKVGLYTCGPTVYDHAHIGNFRSYVFEDLLKRWLQFKGLRVFHVMNLTDIDDKTIRKSTAEGVPLRELTDRYIASFFADLQTLNLLPADVYPRATEHIAGMIEIVQGLLDRGHAYVRDGSVYFRIESFPEYGRLAGLDRTSLQTGTSVDADEYEKENVQDFVLWKGAREGEPSWEAPFGPGRPGWHIECSAMSRRYLGDHFDLHMGGVDNIFPHHENEIAQSRAFSGKPFVNCWVHCQHLIVDNQKMSKSLGNFFTLRDLVAEGHDPLAIRYLLLSTHYRKLLNFSREGIGMAAQSLARIREFAFRLDSEPFPAGAAAEAGPWIEQLVTDFTAAMDDDLNVSGALGALFEFMHTVNQGWSQLRAGDAPLLRDALERINSVLGLGSLGRPAGDRLAEEIERKIAARQEARKNRDFARADAIRDELKALGILLLDTRDGVVWKREKS